MKELALIVAMTIALAAFGSTPTWAQSSGMTCYSRSTGQKVPCPGPKRSQPPVYSPPPSTTPNNNAQIEADKRAAEEAQRRRDEAARAAAAEAERQRLERERQEEFERSKQDGLNKLKGNNAGELTIKGGSDPNPQLKDSTSTEPKLKDATTDYNRVHKSTAVTSVRGIEIFVDPEDVPYDLEGLTAMATKLGWSDEELKRFVVATALVENYRDRFDIAERRKIWADIKARNAGALQAAAAAEKDAGLPSSGFQTGTYSDCVIFAVSSVSRVPYGVTAARATELLKSEEWRMSWERDDPRMEVLRTVPWERRGMTGYEVIFLTEAFGQAEVIKPKDFPSVLNGGRPVLVAVSPGHQVTLSKSFQYKGETWYEMIDSQSKGGMQRRYLKPSELEVLLLEDGVAYRPEPGTTVKSLK